jgi:hypothetical protein
MDAEGCLLCIPAATGSPKILPFASAIRGIATILDGAIFETRHGQALVGQKQQETVML